MKKEKLGILSSDCLHRFVCCVSLLALTLCLSTNASAEKDKNTKNLVKRGEMVMGTVVDCDNNPLTDIKIMESSSEGRVMASTTTDANGDFAFKVYDPKDSLKIKTKGYQTVSVPFDTKFFSIKLEKAPEKKEEEE